MNLIAHDRLDRLYVEANGRRLLRKLRRARPDGRREEEELDRPASNSAKALTLGARHLRVVK
jgi:hypothetical protein